MDGLDASLSVLEGRVGLLEQEAQVSHALVYWGSEVHICKNWRMGYRWGGGFPLSAPPSPPSQHRANVSAGRLLQKTAVLTVCSCRRRCCRRAQQAHTMLVVTAREHGRLVGSSLRTLMMRRLLTMSC